MGGRDARVFGAALNNRHTREFSRLALSASQRSAHCASPFSLVTRTHVPERPAAYMCRTSGGRYCLLLKSSRTRAYLIHIASNYRSKRVWPQDVAGKDGFFLCVCVCPKESCVVAQGLIYAPPNAPRSRATGARSAPIQTELLKFTLTKWNFESQVPNKHGRLLAFRVRNAVLPALRPVRQLEWEIFQWQWR